MPARSRSNEIHLTRLYDAPVEAVWDAWTDPAQAAQWWGPRGFSITTHSKDLRVGGTWRYTMHGPDGTDYPNVTRYLEVEEGRRLVYDHGGTDDTPPLFRVTVVFSEEQGKTKMDMTMGLATPEAAEETRKFIKKAGGNGTWDRLGEYLVKERSAKEVFIINRAFDTPLARMYEMWTDPAHFSRWLPPTGFSMKFLREELRVGGSSFYVMSNDAGVKMYGRLRYLELSPPHRLVYTQEFADEHEAVSRHPALPTWPACTHSIVTFTDEGPERTRVTVEWQPHGAVTAEELAVFVQHKPSMTMGWTGSFDKLEALLE